MQIGVESARRSTANTIVSAIDALGDPDEATEFLEAVDRTVFINDVLRRSVVLVILRHIQTEVYENYEHVALRAREELEFTSQDLQDDGDGDFDYAIQACTELLRTAREAAADCTAVTALERCLSAIIERRLLSSVLVIRRAARQLDNSVRL